MDNLKACKICLVQGVRMFPTQGCLNKYLKELLGHKILYSSDVPPYICYECAYLLEKCIRFKEKCLLGQNVLFEILADKNQITKEDLHSVNRIKMNLVSRLMYYPIPKENIYEFDHEETDFEEVEVKEEVLDMGGSEENNPLIKEEIETSPKKRVHSDDEGDDDSDRFIDDPNDSDDEPKERVHSDDEGDDDRFVDDPNDSDYEPFPEVKVPASPKSKTDVTTYEPKKKKKFSKFQVQSSVNEESWYARLKIKSYPGSKEEEILEKDFIIKKLSKEEQMRDLVRRKELSNYKDSPFKCDICYRGYLQEKTLQNHMIHHALGSGQYECKICVLNLKGRSGFIEHMLKHERRYECKQCAYIAEDLDLAKKHKMWHYGVTYKCQYCNEVSNKLSTHLSHMRNQHPSHYICELCGYSFVSAAGLKLHSSRMHREGAANVNTSQGSTDMEGLSQDGGFYCKECDLQFLSVEALNRHKVTSDKHYDIESNRCLHCGSVFPTGELLRSHQRLHALNLAVKRMLSSKKFNARHRTGNNGEGKALCEHDVNRSQGSTDMEGSIQDGGLHCRECELQSASEEALIRHKVTSDKQYDSDSKGCLRCGSVFPTGELLRSHQRLHALNLALKRMLSRKKIDARHRTGKYGEGKYPAQCEHCKETIKSRELHWKHYQRAHQHQSHLHAQKNFVCELCGKGFPSTAFMTYHARTHTEERPFKCSTCDMSFHTKGNLTVHLKIHEQDRRTTCEVCCKQFKSVKGLQEHVKSHKRAHPCLYCEKAFPRPQGLALHIKKTHMMMAPPGQGQNGT